MVIRVTYLVILINSWLLVSCKIDPNESKQGVTLENFCQDPIEVNYAETFKIDTIKGFQRISILNPATNEFHDYVLVPKGMNTTLVNSDNIIYTPVESFGVLSASFIGFLNELNALDKVKYVENINYIYNSRIHEMFANGEVLESGVLGKMNLEKLVLDGPEVLVLNDFPGEDNQIGTLTKAGIGVMPIMEWQESSPLARAEWIKVFGALLDQEELAIDIFNEVERDYLEAKSVCENSSETTRVLFSSLYQGVWYMPGGGSFVANLISDAKGTYAWKNTSDRASLSLSFEEVILKSSENDVWINPDANSITELLKRDGRYKLLLDKLTLGVFQSNKRLLKEGGNDYWETGVVRPNLILKDLAKILHPDVHSSYELYFFKRL